MLLILASRLARLRDGVEVFAIEAQVLEGICALEIPNHVLDACGEFLYLGPFLLLTL